MNALSPVRSVPGAKGRKFLVALLHQPASSVWGNVHSFHLHVKSWGRILEHWRKAGRKVVFPKANVSPMLSWSRILEHTDEKMAGSRLSGKRHFFTTVLRRDSWTVANSWLKSRLSEKPAFHRCCWRMAEKLLFSPQPWSRILTHRWKGDWKSSFLKKALFHHSPEAGFLNIAEKVAESRLSEKPAFHQCSRRMA